mmetsp:Transcript_46733/g.106013  ORF Transcript_46733/g.106013 Transcript_46733/m.106013 type:complete len:312 (-) Transcript_46733:185-1120(-)
MAPIPPQHLEGEPYETPLAFVGVYSANRNFAKRHAVRRTWGRVLTVMQSKWRLKWKFFLSRLDGEEPIIDARVRREMEDFDDICILDVGDGYKQNSVKGLKFLQYIAEQYSNAEYLVKVDDDIYWRPDPLLTSWLPATLPVRYAWGFWDFISPVPTDENDNFYNPPELFPEGVFPPYQRGVLRVMTMDIVRDIAAMGKAGELQMIFGDDPCSGVHVQQVTKAGKFCAIDDQGSYTFFGMEPACVAKFGQVGAKTWVVHHVGVERIDCMYDADVREGYYTYEGDQLTINAPADGRFPALCDCLGANLTIPNG